jgi:hypothetical protein
MEASSLLRTSLRTPPETKVVTPADDAQLKGAQVLAASASSTFGVRSVRIRITGDGRTIFEGAAPSLYGWVADWNTRGVPDGIYTLYSVADGNTGLVTTSTGVEVGVRN